MTFGGGARDEDAIALDGHLDDLLVGRPGGPSLVLDEVGPGVDPELARAARVVGAALARFHPSFRFEERLAARLRLAAQAAHPDLDERPASAPGVVIPFGAPARVRGRSRRVNGAIIGGAISAGVSLASIAAGALVARRRGRGDGRWERVV
jgi:hypothetical protein